MNGKKRNIAIGCLFFIAWTGTVPAWGAKTQPPPRQVTGYYYDPAEGKIIPKYDDLSPQGVATYLYLKDHPDYYKYLQSLSYSSFRTLDAQYIPYLSPAQIASMPNSDWFNTLSPAQKATLTPEQIQAINTSRVSIGVLSADQRMFLTDKQLLDMGNRYSDYRYVPADKIKILSEDQISSIPNTDWFNTLSAEQKAALSVKQVQAIMTSVVSIGALPADKRLNLTNQQISNIGTRYSDFRYVPDNKVQVLSAAQIATIPNTDWFNTLSASQKAALSSQQIQAINTAAVSIGTLPAEQRTNLTDQQISDINTRYSDYRYVPTEKITILSPAQISSIPNADWFNTLSNAQVQTLTQTQVLSIPASYYNSIKSRLTSEQKAWRP